MQISADFCLKMEKISAVYSEGRVVVPAQNEASSLYQDGYGSLLSDSRLLTLRPFEALYLTEREKISVVDEKSRERLDFQGLILRFTDMDLNIWTRYVVYRDLRVRGFVAREGPGHGVDFLVYERGSYGKRPPRYLVHTVWEGAQEPLRRLGDMLTAAEEAGRILRLAVIDRRGEIVYYTLTEMNLQEPEENSS
jgi:tRNA-intron endonuclease